MLKILVIGNGFDKAHNLKTGYGDFLDWFNYIVEAHDINIRGGLVTIPIEEFSKCKEFKQNNPIQFQEVIEARDNFWKKHFDKIRSEIGDMWLDFETEIEVLTKRIYEKVHSESIRTTRKMVSTECQNGIEVPHFSTVNELFKWLYLELRQLTRILEIYLCKCANKSITADARMELFTSIKANKLISFNYTSTYQDVYNRTIQTDYIHGKAVMAKQSQECNLVLGYDDHYIDTVDVIPELIPFEKYYQRIVYRNSNNYFNWMSAEDKNGNAELKEVHIYGHSLSPADGDIIKLLIEAENTRTKIYYRKEYEEDRANMIKNLAIILSPNGLIKRMGGNNPTIELIPV